MGTKRVAPNNPAASTSIPRHSPRRRKKAASSTRRKASSAFRRDSRPYKGRIYDPCCGSAHVRQRRNSSKPTAASRDIAIYGHDSTPPPAPRRHEHRREASRRLAPEHADPFRRDLHPDLRVDFVLANPPFNDSDWFRKDDDVRWQYGVPPRGNANFAWVQHFIHHLAPHGMAGFVLANGSMSSNQSGEGDIRRALIEADLVDCMVALPGQLFYSTPIPVCLWFLSKSKTARVINLANADELPDCYAIAAARPFFY